MRLDLPSDAAPGAVYEATYQVLGVQGHMRRTGLGGCLVSVICPHRVVQA
ncbi:hypothetical protein FHR71_003951 [Methylobacterium sp. RAS18]|nr:hypothetical protein [Methylobacterium sp. RAS18]